MKLNSEFSVIKYDGLSTFDLMHRPSGLVADPNNPGSNIVNPNYLDYNSFIDGIATIYGSQNISGIIPTFWTIPSGEGYVPSPDSTLTGLAPNNSYYFIVRSQSVLPLNIPGSSPIIPPDPDPCTTEYASIPCCKDPTAAAIWGDVAEESGMFTFSGISTRFGTPCSFITLTGDPIHKKYQYETPVSILLSGLKAFANYTYSISSTGTFGSVISGPLTDTFYTGPAPSGKKSLNPVINHEFNFDLSYDHNGINICHHPDNIMSTITVDAYDVSGICQSVVGSFIVRCLDCIPTPETPVIFINGSETKAAGHFSASGPDAFRIITSGQNNRHHNLSILVSGLDSNYDYAYNISEIDSSCGYALSNSTGNLKSNGTSAIINTKFQFDKSCDDLNSCNGDKVYSTLNVNITNLTHPCNYNNQSITIECVDCLEPCVPCPELSLFINGDLSTANKKYTNDGMDPYTVTLTGVGNNSHNLSVLLSGLIPNKSYSYTLNSVRHSLDSFMYPTTGSFIPQGDHHIISSEFYFIPTGTITEPSIYDVRRLSLTTPSGCSFVEQDIDILCEDCLPKPTGCAYIKNDIDMYINGDDSKAAGHYVNNTLNPYQVTLSGVGNNYYNLSILLSGLVPNITYTYNTSSSHGNWPYIFNGGSGTFKTAADNYMINTEFYFDSTYIDPESQSSCATSKTLYRLLDFSLVPENNCGSSLGESVRIECKDCLPACPSVPSLSFLDSPSLTVASGCCNIDNPVGLSISGASPGIQYTYEFTVLPSGSSATISPATGTVAFGSTGSGKVFTLLNPNNNSPLLLKGTLRTPNDNISTDFLSVVCAASGSPTPAPTSFDTTLSILTGTSSASGSGVSIAGNAGTSLSFNYRTPSGLPGATMSVYIGGVQKAQITFYADSQLNQSLRLIIDGTTYNTTFIIGRKDL